MVTHDPRAAHAAQRTVQLDKGRILADEEVGVAS
jgi:ABC-type lipoprotein export system ATPase subunit